MKYRIVQRKLTEKPPPLCGSALRVILSGGGTVECEPKDYPKCKAGIHAVHFEWVAQLQEAGFLEELPE